MNHGIPAKDVTDRTQVLVVGQQDYRVVGESGLSNKQKKAMAKLDKGQEIEILSEAEFLQMF
jgi:DNA polymerase-3 subunit epsilon